MLKKHIFIQQLSFNDDVTVATNHLIFIFYF
jgi:hypothetical protein